MQRHDIDVLALQETKAREDQLPLMGLAGAGLRGRVARPQPVERRRDRQPGRARGRRASASPGMPGWGDPVAAEARAIGATCGGVRVWSLYVPERPQARRPALRLQAGLARRRLRDAAAGWLADDPDRRSRWSATGTSRPRDEDVFDMAQFAKSTHVTPPERAAFQAFLDDGLRRRRAAAPRRARRSTPTGTTTGSASSGTAGMRIDFVLGSPALAARVTGAFIDRDERAGTGRQRPRPGDRRPRRLSRLTRDGRAGGRPSVEGHLRPAASSATRRSTSWRSSSAEPQERRDRREVADVLPAGARSRAGRAGRAARRSNRPDPRCPRRASSAPGCPVGRRGTPGRRRARDRAAPTACIDAGSASRSWLPKTARTPPGSSSSAAWVQRGRGSVQCQDAAA